MMNLRFTIAPALRLAPQAKRRVGGSSLMELIVTTAVAAIIMAALMSSFIFCKRSFLAMGNYMDLDRASLVALDTMSKDIRQMVSLKSFATNQLVFLDLNANQLTYAWDANTRQLTRTYGGDSKVLLKQCDLLSFNISTGAPRTDGVFGFNTATNNPNLCKMVDITWRCSRTIMGVKANTESVQTAKIALRN